MNDAEKELKDIFRQWQTDWYFRAANKIEQTLLDWHESHAHAKRKVERKEIEKIVNTGFQNITYKHPGLGEIVDDIMVVLNGQEKEPEWCCKLQKEYQAYVQCHPDSTAGLLEPSIRIMTFRNHEWNYCQFCGKQRTRPQEKME